MFKNLSIRTKITMWFSLALILVVGLTYFVVSRVTKDVLLKGLQDNLIEIVLSNMSGLHYVDNYADLSERDQNMVYGDGYIAIDENFLDVVNGVYTALYTDEHTMLYGENPISKQSTIIDFQNRQIQTINIDGITHYIFDVELGNNSDNSYDGLWIRGIVPETTGLLYAGDIRTAGYVVLPIIGLIAIIGGYFIVKHNLSPIIRVTKAADRIQESGNLSERVDIGDGRDEAHQLASTFNSMLNRIEDAFDRQKQFISDASHELRTPTTVILAQAEFYLEKERTQEEYIRALTVIERQGNKMKDLINSMLDISRLEMKPENYKILTLDLSKMVENSCQEYALVKEKNISLEYNIEDEKILVNGNKELLSRALANLISNAYRYGNEDGNIWVNLKKDKGYAVLSVRDNGQGISKEDHEKIFRRFYQADVSRKNQGSGLGLSMVKEIVDFHNGTINLESMPGVGTIFTIKLRVT